MTEPAISRRCPDCGASIRERAVFCPQCGRQLQMVVETPTLPTQTIVEQPASATGNPDETLLEKPDASVAADDLRQRPGSKVSGENSADYPQGERILTPRAGNGQVTERGYRATATAREVIEDNLLPRVEKLRKASSEVIDQAAYDPSFRFVLVAALLFAVFIVILIINELV